MENVVIYLALILTGLCLGSFAGAMVWRLRARQLSEDKAHHEEYDKDEYQRLKKLTTGGAAHDRSRCLHCSYVLRWYDLIPLVSWLSLRGKCRQCHIPIGYLEPLIELGVALLFVLFIRFLALSAGNTSRDYSVHYLARRRSRVGYLIFLRHQVVSVTGQSQFRRYWSRGPQRGNRHTTVSR